jgi:hypothetical protein
MLSVIMLSVIMLSVIMLSVIMLSVIILSVIMLIVVMQCGSQPKFLLGVLLGLALVLRASIRPNALAYLLSSSVTK